MPYSLNKSKRNHFYFFSGTKSQGSVVIILLSLGVSLVHGISADYVRWGYHHFISMPMPIGGIQPFLSSRGTHSRSIQDELSRSSSSHRRLPIHLDTLSATLKGFCHPLKGKGFLSQGIRGPTHQGRMEYAYDFGTPIGTPIYAMQSGRVIGIQDRYVDIGGKQGKAQEANFIWLEHSNGVGSAYTHLQQRFGKKTSIQLNDWVKKGQLIGYSGNSGWSSAPHLHVEVHHINNHTFGKTLPFSISASCKSEQFV